MEDFVQKARRPRRYWRRREGRDYDYLARDCVSRCDLCGDLRDRTAQIDRGTLAPDIVREHNEDICFAAG